MNRFAFVLGIFCLLESAHARVPEALVSSGLVFPSPSDSVRYNASVLPLVARSHAEVLLGLPVEQGESIRGVAAIKGKLESAGIGAALEYWNPLLVFRAGLGVPMTLGRGTMSLGASLTYFKDTWEDGSASEGGGSLGQEGGTTQTSPAVLDAHFSASWQSEQFRATVIMHSVRDGFPILTGGFGFAGENVFFELDTEWVRNKYNDLFFMPGLGFSSGKWSGAVRYFVSYLETGTTQGRTWAGGDWSAGLGMQINSNQSIRALYKYDPNTWNLGFLHRF